MANTINDFFGGTWYSPIKVLPQEPKKNENHLGEYGYNPNDLVTFGTPKKSDMGTRQPPIIVTQETTDVNSGSTSSSNNTSTNGTNNTPKKKNTLSPTIKWGLIIGGGILAYILIKKIKK
jgi:hypothetical protein